MVQKNNINVLCILVIIGWLLNFNIIYGEEKEEKDILFISSYNPNVETFSDQIEGIHAGINEDVNLQIEYMDSRTFLGKENKEQFYKLLKQKLRGKNGYDLVILGDDQALQFGMEHRDELFKNIPIVFLGVSSNERIQLAKKENQVFGVTEPQSIKENIKLISKLHKGKDITIVTDSYSDCIDLDYNLNTLKKEFKNINFHEISLKDMSFYEFKQKLRTLNNDDILFVMYAYRDKLGNVKTIKGAYKLISENAKVPIYCTMNYGVECGFVGGKVVSHFDQGKEAGKIAREILYGKEPEQKIVNGNNVNGYIFDYNKLKYNNINIKKLPGESHVVNSPIDTLYKYKEMVYGYVALTISLLIVILSLILYTIKKLQYEKELIKAKETAEGMHKSQSNFISNISHELRTPVAVIMSANQILDINMKKVNNDYSESNFNKINIIKQNCNRLLRLTNNIIDMAKVDSGFMDLKLKNIDIIFLLESIVTSVIPYADCKNIDIIFDTNCEELVMSVDPDKIERIVLNLISNAIKFSKDNTNIYINVTVYENENRLEFSVRDTGIGMADKDLERIFDRFTQVDDIMVRKNEGSGIGLSLVKIFTTLHNGNVIVNSKLGQGSEFIVILPIEVMKNDIDSEMNQYSSSGSQAALEFSDISF
nr:ABC transporter substrate binding protein [Paeniclostridium ghonii]MCM0166653.1 sensor histidine kinase [Paeniclostridium ghonii]